jgi:periplasmic divalent cation tolerance protein
MSEIGIVFMTAARREEAELLARALVEKRLAACVQIISDIRSVYWWQGRVCDEPETLCMAKTTAACFDELSAEVKRLHSYDVPEIVFVPIADASPEYRQWIVRETRQPSGGC